MKILKKIINKINEKRQEKMHKRCQMMNSEIICAIAHQVKKEQEKENVSIPVFMEVQSRYDSLKLQSYQDVVNAYKLFYNKGLVSGISL